MTRMRGSMAFSCEAFSILLFMISLISPIRADSNEIEWIPYTTDAGTIYLDNDRQPSLYTESFGDCQGDSLIEITRFDASLYTDNMTVMLHLEGSTSLPSQKVMMLISVEAYGESRLDMIINPCTIDTPTLCPIRPEVPIVANGLIPISAENLANVPNIAYTIPDFEGQAVLKFFNYPSQQQLGCYAAAMTNGNSFSHPEIVGAILGLFTLIALISSVAVAVYGHVVSEIRLHHAHSISIFVVFSVFHHIFFSGTLSVHWPSVLVAFWSNYAWTAGMIYTQGMQDSINSFIGQNFGNITKIGATPANTNVSNLGGTYDASKIDGIARFAVRSALDDMGSIVSRSSVIEDKSTGFIWYGNAVRPGLPLPGNFTGFAGTLSELSIPASNVFLTALIWLLIAILIVVTSMTALKWCLELCAKRQWIKSSGWSLFRSHWLRFTVVAVFRLCFIAFSMMTTLALFQFAFGGTDGTLALAAVVFVLFVAGLLGISSYALWHRLRFKKLQIRSGQLQLFAEKKGVNFQRGSTFSRSQGTILSVPWIDVVSIDPENRPHVHEDTDYIMKFGWLSSRFRKSKWWFFSVWLFYELIRSCFHGGAVVNSLAQIIGLLVWEFVAFLVLLYTKPFESNRLNMIMVYVLGLSKIITAGLSLALDSQFSLGRIPATAIGIIIIIVQGLLTVCLLIAIALGAVSSYLSIKRDRTNAEFTPRRWVGYRARYFARIEQTATDRRTITLVTEPQAEKADIPKFAVTTVRREPKIEDQEESAAVTIDQLSQTYSNQESLASPFVSRPASMRSYSSNVPFGARLSRAAWSVKDMSEIDHGQVPIERYPRTSFYSMTDTVPTRHRSTSLRDHVVQPQSFHGMSYDTQATRRSTMSATQARPRFYPPTAQITRLPAARPSSMTAEPTAWLRHPQMNTADSNDSISAINTLQTWPPSDWNPDNILPHDPFRRFSSSSESDPSDRSYFTSEYQYHNHELHEPFSPTLYLQSMI